MEKIAFLFPGQGSQFVGMSKSIYDQFPIVRQTYEEASDILGYDLAKVTFNGPLSQLSKPDVIQVAILTSSISTYRVYMQELGIVPQFCAGHSLGEYSALTCTGALQFSDAVKLLRYRGQLTEEVLKNELGSMTIIDGVDRDLVEEECKKVSREGHIVSVSCYNSPDQTAISGHKEAVMEVEERLLEKNCAVTPLIDNAPFHCSLMQPVGELLKAEISKYLIGYFKYPLITNVNARPLTDPDKVADNIAKQIVMPVQWEATMQYLKNMGVTLAIEMGPKNLLSNLVRANVEGIDALCYGVKDDCREVGEILGKYPFLRKHIPTVITRCLAVAVSTPNKNFNNEEYEQYVIQSYRKIDNLQKQLEEKDSKPTKEDMVTALDLLKVILKTKKVDIEEQRRWFRQIIDETGTYYVLSDYELP